MGVQNNFIIPRKVEDDELESEQRALLSTSSSISQRLNEKGNEASQAMLIQCVANLKANGSEKWGGFVETLSVSMESDLSQVDVHDDLARELAFYSAALAAAGKGHRSLRSKNIQFQRPGDYFAEMLKSDSHMARVKKELLFEQQRMKAVEQRKKAQHNRKYQKEIQNAKQQQRLKSKKAAMNAVESFRKKTGKPSVSLDNEKELFDVHLDKVERGFKRKNEAPQKSKSKKRLKADKKYGFGGGRPRDKKRNDAKSANDMSGYFRHQNSGNSGRKFQKGKKGKGGKGKKRPGKNARRR
eukprot:g4710.t1